VDDGIAYVRIAGVSFYQEALERCAAGEPVRFVHEPDNPHDELALQVVSMCGETIGYVPRGSWLRIAIHEQGRGVSGVIASIGYSRSVNSVRSSALPCATTPQPLGRIIQIASRPNRPKAGLGIGSVPQKPPRGSWQNENDGRGPFQLDIFHVCGIQRTQRPKPRSTTASEQLDVREPDSAVVANIL
jgi:hypothetical protein